MRWRGSATLILLGILVWNAAALAADLPVTFSGSVGLTAVLSDPDVGTSDDRSAALRQAYRLQVTGPIYDPIVGSYSAQVSANVNSNEYESTPGELSTSNWQGLTVDARLFPLSPLTLALGAGVRSSDDSSEYDSVKLTETSAYGRVGLALPNKPSVTVTASHVADKTEEVADGLSMTKDSTIDQVEVGSQYSFGRRNYASLTLISRHQLDDADGGRDQQAFSGAGSLTLSPTDRLQVGLSGDTGTTETEKTDTGEIGKTTSSGIDVRTTYAISPNYSLRSRITHRDLDYSRDENTYDGGTDQYQVSLDGVLHSGLYLTASADVSDSTSLSVQDLNDGTNETTSTETARKIGRVEVRSTQIKGAALSAATEYQQLSTNGLDNVPVLKAQGRAEVQPLDFVGLVLDVSQTSPLEDPVVATDVESGSAIQGQVSLLSRNASQVTLGYKTADNRYHDDRLDSQEKAASLTGSVAPFSFLTLSGTYQSVRTDYVNDALQPWEETAGTTANVLYRPTPELTLTLAFSDQSSRSWSLVTLDTSQLIKRHQQGITARADYQFYEVKLSLEAAAKRVSSDGFEREDTQSIMLSALRNF